MPLGLRYWHFGPRPCCWMMHGSVLTLALLQRTWFYHHFLGVWVITEEFFFTSAWLFSKMKQRLLIAVRTLIKTYRTKLQSRSYQSKFFLHFCVLNVHKCFVNVLDRHELALVWWDTGVSRHSLMVYRSQWAPGPLRVQSRNLRQEINNLWMTEKLWK